jgi:hypothetical protein
MLHASAHTFSLNQPCMKWFLGSDGQTNGIVETLAGEYGAVTFNVAEARKSGLLRPPAAGSGLLVPPEGGYREGQVHRQHWRGHIERLEAAYLDIYLLTFGEVFVGNVYSTFSSTVCKMRPEVIMKSPGFCLYNYQSSLRDMMHM